MNIRDTLKACKKDFFEHNKGREYLVFPTDVYTKDKHFEYVTENGHLMTKEFYIEHFHTEKIAYFLE